VFWKNKCAEIGREPPILRLPTQFSTNVPLLPCTLSNFKGFYPDVSSFGPVSGVHALALVHDVAGIHAIESVSSVVSPTVSSVHALVFTHALAGTHVLACVSQVVGFTVAGVVAL
jgi:hypothetical protein